MFKFVMHGTYNQFSDKNQNDRFIKIFPISNQSRRLIVIFHILHS